MSNKNIALLEDTYSSSTSRKKKKIYILPQGKMQAEC